MLQKPACDDLVLVGEREIIDSKQVDWAAKCCSTSLRWTAFQDPLSRRFLLLRDGHGEVKLWCSVGELAGWTAEEVEDRLISGDRNRDNLQLCFVGEPEIPRLILELDVCEIPWRREWITEMTTMSSDEFPEYCRLNVWPFLTGPQRARIQNRLEEVFIAFGVYRQALQTNGE